MTDCPLIRSVPWWLTCVFCTQQRFHLMQNIKIPAFEDYHVTHEINIIYLIGMMHFWLSWPTTILFISNNKGYCCVYFFCHLVINDNPNYCWLLALPLCFFHCQLLVTMDIQKDHGYVWPKPQLSHNLFINTDLNWNIDNFILNFLHILQLPLTLTYGTNQNVLWPFACWEKIFQSGNNHCWLNFVHLLMISNHTLQ